MRVTGSDWSSRPDKSFFIPRSTRSKYRTCNEAPAETTNGFIVARKTSDPYPKLCATLRVLSLRHHHPPIIIIAIVIAMASFIQHLTLLCLRSRVSPHLNISRGLIYELLSCNYHGRSSSSPSSSQDAHLCKKRAVHSMLIVGWQKETIEEHSSLPLENLIL